MSHRKDAKTLSVAHGVLFVLSCIAALAPAVFAQGYKPIIDHVHLAAPDPLAAVAWYQKYFGGKTIPEATDRFLVGDVRVIFSKREKTLPSQGSAIDHIGFSVASLDSAMKAFQSDGVKIVTPARDVPGLFPLAFIEDPWGTKIEVVQDPAGSACITCIFAAPIPLRCSRGMRRSSAARWTSSKGG